MKYYYQQNNIGKAKYSVSFHNGYKANKDGSPFEDIRLFTNQKMRDIFIDYLESDGYIYK